MEIRLLRKAIGPIALAAIGAYGIKIPETRAELDELMTRLIDGRPV